MRCPKCGSKRYEVDVADHGDRLFGVLRKPSGEEVPDAFIEGLVVSEEEIRDRLKDKGTDPGDAWFRYVDGVLWLKTLGLPQDLRGEGYGAEFIEEIEKVRRAVVRSTWRSVGFYESMGCEVIPSRTDLPMLGKRL